MKLSRRVPQVWNWLPAFRAVAEAEHLPTAAKEAHVSASALSRSVRLLEDDLGVELFAREGRQLELTTAGRRLLDATRSAMRTVESALDQMLSSESAGDVHVSAPGPYCSVFILPALRRLRAEYPGIVPHLSSATPGERERKLLDGALDIALAGEAEARPELSVTRLGELSYSIYAAEDHPLASKVDVGLDDILQHPFVGPPGHLVDHWPPHLVRRIGMVVEQLHVAVQACAFDGLLAILPDAVAASWHGEAALVRLPVEIVPPQPLYAISRRAAAEPRRIEIVLRALAATFEDMRRGARRSTVPPVRSTMRPPAWLDRPEALAAPRAPRSLAAGDDDDDDAPR